MARRAKIDVRKTKRPAPIQSAAPAPRRGGGGGTVVRAMAAALWLVLIGGVGFFWVAHDLPDFDDARALNDARAQGVLLLDRSGRRIAAHGDAFARDVALSALPDHVPAAVVAVEDKRFYDHVGLDPIGLARAAWANVRARRIVQGGSTITQQLAKNLFLSPERTIRRKAQEALLALRLEARFSKDQILETYLNRVYFGSGAYGVEAAAQTYFGKSATRVSVAEAALLAGLLKAPSRLSPNRDAQTTAARTDLVLDRMVATGMLSPVGAMAAASEPIYLAEDAGTPGSGHFADWAAGEARALAGADAQGPLKVITTLDLAAQRAAEIAVAEAAADLDGRGGGAEAALVALDGSGGVRAMVGGRSYRTSQFNRAVLAERQLGSAFKPFVYLAALETGWAPWDMIDDAPVRVGDWAPKNYADRYFGRIDLTTALSKSANSAAVRLSQDVGVRAGARTARRLGLDNAPLTDRPSLALGAVETSPLMVARAYLPFANGGRRVAPHTILMIEDARGRRVYARDVNGEIGPQVIDDERLAQMNAMMKRTVAAGTGRAAAQTYREVAGKTGTSTDFRDAWFVGYAADFAAAVWVGRDDDGPMDGVTGGTIPARIWAAFAERALASTAERPLPGNVDDLKPSNERAPVAELESEKLEALIRARMEPDDPERREGRRPD